MKIYIPTLLIDLILLNLFYEQRSHLEGEWRLNSIRMKSRDWLSRDFTDSCKSQLKRSRLR